MSILKKTIFYLIIIMFVFILGPSFLKNSWRLMHADERVHLTEDKLMSLKAENKKLSQKFKYYQSDEFIEEQIRNKLQMAKPGETILLLPRELKREEIKEAGKEKTKELANWQKWLKLFL